MSSILPFRPARRARAEVRASFTGEMTWVSNWLLWDALRWSDMGAFELEARALWLNRLLVLGLAVAFWAVAVRSYGRRSLDGARLFGRLHPVAVLRAARGLAAYAVVPAVAAAVLWWTVVDGFQEEAAELADKGYWSQNFATWRDAPQPDLTRIDLDLDFEPAERTFHTRGTYQLVNHHTRSLTRFGLTGGGHWRDLSQTVNGEAYEPEDRSRLYVFEPESPLLPGQRVRRGRGGDGEGEESQDGNALRVLPHDGAKLSEKPRCALGGSATGWLRPCRDRDPSRARLEYT